MSRRSRNIALNHLLRSDKSTVECSGSSACQYSVLLIYRWILQAQKEICSFAEAEQHGIILTVLPTIAQQLHRLYGSRDTVENKLVSLQSLIGVLHCNCRSVLSHEHMCLTNIVGFNNQSVLNAPSSEANHRMLAFWLLTNDNSLDIIFRVHEKLDFLGLYWAPRSLRSTKRL